MLLFTVHASLFRDAVGYLEYTAARQQRQAARHRHTAAIRLSAANTSGCQSTITIHPSTYISLYILTSHHPTTCPPLPSRLLIQSLLPLPHLSSVRTLFPQRHAHFLAPWHLPRTHPSQRPTQRETRPKRRFRSCVLCFNATPITPIYR